MLTVGQITCHTPNDVGLFLPIFTAGGIRWDASERINNLTHTVNRAARLWI